jgi:hypothetical protein
VGAIATVIGTVVAIVTGIRGIKSEKKKIENRTRTVYPTQIDRGPTEKLSIPHEIPKPDPFLYISVSLIGACGGAASILVPALLLQALPDYQCFFYPLLVVGIIGGVLFALFMDSVFSMQESTVFLRFSLSAISGVLGGWIGLIGAAIFALYKMITAENTPPSNTNK